MSDEREIRETMEARSHAPTAIRTLAQIARDVDDATARRDAIASLVAHRFLIVSNPSDDELERIENMTDGEINAVLRATSN